MRRRSGPVGDDATHPPKTHRRSGFRLFFGRDVGHARSPRGWGHRSLLSSNRFPTGCSHCCAQADQTADAIIERCVQDVNISVFEQLQAGDILFINSSHVAKVGSDLTDILLRILPVLKAGCLVHFHDMFYPEPIPGGGLRRASLERNPVCPLVPAVQYQFRSNALQFVCGQGVPGPVVRPSLSRPPLRVSAEKKWDAPT